MAEATHTPTAEEIQELLKGIDRYNPSNLAMLEAYVQQQITTNTIDLEANLATLKLYQYNPHTVNRDIVVLILLKGIMTLPSPDVTLSLGLLNEDMLQDEHVRQVTYLCQLLETCHFREFWNELPGSSVVFDHAKIPGFDSAIRAYIVSVLLISYQKIQKQLLGDFLNFQGAELDAVIKTSGWDDNVAEGLVYLNTNLESALKPRSIAEKVDYEYMAGILGGAL